MKKKIYLVRHCKAEGQAFSANLTTEGIEQAKALSEFLFHKNIDVIISSPYLRAIDSVTPLAEKLNIQILKDKRLSERVLSSEDHPDWLNMLKNSFADLDLCYDGGESSKQAMDRGNSVIKEVINSNNQNTVIATHGNLMSLILRYYDSTFGFEQWKALSNPDVYSLEVNDQSYSIKRIWES